jgi:LPXTG-motif cell wall-anchored protein
VAYNSWIVPAGGDDFSWLTIDRCAVHVVWGDARTSPQDPTPTVRSVYYAAISDGGMATCPSSAKASVVEGSRATPAVRAPSAGAPTAGSRLAATGDTRGWLALVGALSVGVALALAVLRRRADV